jgi:hypothetical protein
MASGGDPLVALGLIALCIFWCWSYSYLLVRGMSDVPLNSASGEVSAAFRVAFGVFPVALISALLGPFLMHGVLELVFGGNFPPAYVGLAIIFGIPVTALAAWLLAIIRGSILARALPPGRKRFSRAALTGFVLFYAITVGAAFAPPILTIMFTPYR